MKESIGLKLLMNDNHIWFTADTHFDHTNIIRHCNRPFSNTEEMNKTIITNWNLKVGKQDQVYHLGDFGFSENSQEYLKRLNGKISILFGNHDREAKRYKHLFSEYFHGILELKIGDLFIVCCHYPMLEWNRSYHGSLCLYGHVHSNSDKPFQAPSNSYDVGMDNNDFFPVSLSEILAKIKEAQS